MFSSSAPILPTTVMERYLARPSHGSGMVFSLTLVLDGSIEIESFRRGWFATLALHPRTHARLVGRGRRQHWVGQPHAADTSFVYREVAADLPDVDAASVCPRAGIGAKCVIEPLGTQRWSIRLLFHHACCDGVGAIRLTGQILRAYSQVQTVDRRLDPSEAQAPDEFRRTEPSGNNLPPTPIAPLPNLNNLWTTIRGTNVRLCPPTDHPAPSHPAPSHPVADRPTGITTFQNSSRLMFSRSVSDQIRSVLRARKITLNDWSLAVTLHTLATFTRSSASPRQHVMVMNPVELRTWAQRRDIHNHIGIAFVRRTHQQLSDIDQTLASVSTQMQDVRRQGTARELASGIAVAERIPGSLGLIERWGAFTPTAALTSVAGLRLGKRLGIRHHNNRLWVGNLELRDVYFEGAIQAGGQVSTTIWEFKQQIAVSNRTVPHLLDPATNHQLLALWENIATLSMKPFGLASS